MWPLFVGSLFFGDHYIAVIEQIEFSKQLISMWAIVIKTFQFRMDFIVRIHDLKFEEHLTDKIVRTSSSISI